MPFESTTLWNRFGVSNNLWQCGDKSETDDVRVRFKLGVCQLLGMIFIELICWLLHDSQDKASNAASNVGDNLKQNLDQGTGAVKNVADDASRDAKKNVDRL